MNNLQKSFNNYGKSLLQSDNASECKYKACIFKTNKDALKTSVWNIEFRC